VFDDYAGLDIPADEANLVLSSVSEGRQLRLNLKRLNVELNPTFPDRIVKRDSLPRKFGNLAMKVIGPTEEEWQDLRKKWKSELPKILKKEADAKTAAVSLDTSFSNLASIVTIARIDEHSILFMGDARADMVYQWLEQSGELDSDGKAPFDIIKIGITVALGIFHRSSSKK